GKLILNSEEMRFLAIDPGEKNIGLALSDPTGTIASPLMVLKHSSRSEDAAAILDIAQKNEVQQIIVGQALDEDGQPSFEGRKAARLAGAIRARTSLPVILWDESESTQTARAAQIHMETPRRKRRGHLDELAAVVILQTYLDQLNKPSNETDKNSN
ncbi:MAG: Holliday junction resolvase RuvX, partial [Anaerolineales bacterium]